jgi:hypothetical protein
MQVAFDEKMSSPVEAIQLLNDVFAELDKVHKVEARDEAPELAIQRISNFLTVIKYPFPSDM